MVDAYKKLRQPRVSTLCGKVWFKKSLRTFNGRLHDWFRQRYEISMSLLLTIFIQEQNNPSVAYTRMKQKRSQRSKTRTWRWRVYKKPVIDMHMDYLPQSWACVSHRNFQVVDRYWISAPQMTTSLLEKKRINHGCDISKWDLSNMYSCNDQHDGCHCRSRIYKPLRSNWYHPYSLWLGSFCAVYEAFYGLVWLFVMVCICCHDVVSFFEFPV